MTPSITSVVLSLNPNWLKGSRWMMLEQYLQSRDLVIVVITYLHISEDENRALALLNVPVKEDRLRAWSIWVRETVAYQMWYGDGMGTGLSEYRTCLQDRMLELEGGGDWVATSYLPFRRLYHRGGIKKGRLVCEAWCESGPVDRAYLHRDENDGPAVMDTDIMTGTVIFKYYKHGLLHRENGPAWIERDASGKVILEERILNGVCQDPTRISLPQPLTLCSFYKFRHWF
jgi:hypothetical protein